MRNSSTTFYEVILTFTVFTVRTASVTIKNSKAKGSQDDNWAFKDAHPNNNIAKPKVSVNENVNQRNSTNIRRAAVCMLLMS